MANRLSFDKIEKFYEVLARYKNEDGYSLASMGFAAAHTKLPSGSAKSVIKILQAIGSIKVYAAPRDASGEVEVTSPFVQKAESQFTLIKVCDVPPTKKRYGLYLVEGSQ